MEDIRKGQCAYSKPGRVLEGDYPRIQERLHRSMHSLQILHSKLPDEAGHSGAFEGLQRIQVRQTLGEQPAQDSSREDAVQLRRLRLVRRALPAGYRHPGPDEEADQAQRDRQRGLRRRFNKKQVEKESDC